MSGQSTFEQFENDLTDLSPTERRVYLAVEKGEKGVREVQREQGWSSPGTAGNLLSRARGKLDEEGGSDG